MRNQVRLCLTEIVGRIADHSEEIQQIIGQSRSNKQLETDLSDFVSARVAEAADGNIAVTEYVQRNMAKQSVYVFVGTHWVLIKMQKFYDFCKDAAYHMGLPQKFAERPRFMNLVFEQTAFNVSRDREQVVPPDEVWTNLQNCTLEIHSDGQIYQRPHQREDFFTYVLPYDYDPTAKCRRWHRFLNQVLPDKDSQRLLGEHIGYCFTRNLKLERMLVLYGGGSNGKSVTTDVVVELLGRMNVSHVDLEKLTTDDNHRAQAVGKLANISQENGPNIQYSILKNMISGEPVMVKNLYKDPYPTSDYGKIIASYNTLPKPEQTHGNFRRWDILEYGVTIGEEERDIHLKDKLCRELPGILNWVLGCLTGLIQRGGFISSESSRQSLKKYMHDSNSALRFFDEMCMLDEEGCVTVNELFAAYKNFCRDEGVVNLFGKINFLRQLEQLGVHQRRSNIARYLNVKMKGEIQ